MTKLDILLCNSILAQYKAGTLKWQDMTEQEKQIVRIMLCDLPKEEA